MREDLIQKIIECYPLIIKYRIINFTFDDIVGILERTHNLNFEVKQPRLFLRDIVNRITKGTINNQFAKYKLLTNIIHEEDKYLPICAEIGANLYLTYSNILVDKKYVVTSDNIKDISTLKAAVIAKWLLRIYDISNDEFVKQYKESYISTHKKEVDIPQETTDFINNITINILPLFETVTTNLYNKFITLKGHEYEVIKN